MSTSEIAGEADRMLEEYLLRFPDPPGKERAVLSEDSINYLAPEPAVLTAAEAQPIVQES